MAEYIEREALENELYRRLKFLIDEYGEHDQYTSGFDDAMDMVISFTAADVVPVVHGKWVKAHWKNSVSCANCSICGFEAYHYDFQGVQKTYNYCPNCGAKMDGEEQDDELIL